MPGFTVAGLARAGVTVADIKVEPALARLGGTSAAFDRAWRSLMDAAERLPSTPPEAKR